MINLADNELLIWCSCHSNDHLAWLIDDDDCWYLSMTLDHFSFWKRIRKGLRYVFAPLSLKFGMSTELVLRSEDVDRVMYRGAGDTKDAANYRCE